LPTTRTIRAGSPGRGIEGARGRGYAYESANASFDLLARRTLGRVPEYFQVEQFDVNVEQRYNANGQRVTVAMAVVKVDVAGEK
jgi:2-isopropylmalate synthase